MEDDDIKKLKQGKIKIDLVELFEINGWDLGVLEQIANSKSTSSGPKNE